jgi:hypothetical protein
MDANKNELFEKQLEFMNKLGAHHVDFRNRIQCILNENKGDKNSFQFKHMWPKLKKWKKFFAPLN